METVFRFGIVLHSIKSQKTSVTGTEISKDVHVSQQADWLPTFCIRLLQILSKPIISSRFLLGVSEISLFFTCMKI
jgi:hypothetical protein